jgi:hypothetical protein
MHISDALRTLPVRALHAMQQTSRLSRFRARFVRQTQGIDQPRRQLVSYVHWMQSRPVSAAKRRTSPNERIHSSDGPGERASQPSVRKGSDRRDGGRVGPFEGGIGRVGVPVLVGGGATSGPWPLNASRPVVWS